MNTNTNTNTEHNMKPRSLVLYTRISAPPAEYADEYTRVGPVWVRTEEFDLPVGQALDRAELRAGEVVSNSHPLPDPCAYRLLAPGDIIDGRDERTVDNGGSWQASASAGEVFDYSQHFPHRRQLRSYEDLY